MFEPKRYPVTLKCKGKHYKKMEDYIILTAFDKQEYKNITLLFFLKDIDIGYRFPMLYHERLSWRIRINETIYRLS